MTARKTGLLTAGFVAVFAVGVVTGPTIRENWSRTHAPGAAVTSPADNAAPEPVKAEPRARARSSSPDAVATKKPSSTIRTVAVSVWEPELRDKVKKVLNPGSRLEIAAADFETTEQFVTVAHAARNTQVPFMVLKDRVLYQGQSLAAAIEEFKPELDEKAEVTRARAAARADLDIAN